ncbi:hypothetical protein BH23ACT7_BH23ACT7_00570 [soil metagenome]|jgi:hypothetical protein
MATAPVPARPLRELELEVLDCVDGIVSQTALLTGVIAPGAHLQRIEEMLKANSPRRCTSGCVTSTGCGWA